VYSAPSNNNNIKEVSTKTTDNVPEQITIVAPTHAALDHASSSSINESNRAEAVSEQRDNGLENLSMLRTEVN